MSKVTRAKSASPRMVLALALQGASVAAVIVAVLMLGRSVGRTDATFLLPIVGGPIFTIVGSFILIRRPGHRIGVLMTANGLALTTVLAGNLLTATVDPLGYRLGPLTSIVEAVSSAITSLTILVGSILLIVWFPDGHRTSRLGAILEATLLAVAAVLLVGMVVPAVQDVFSSWGIAIVLATYGFAFVDLLFRYRRADALRQAQIRWVMAAAGLTSVLILAMLLFGDRLEFLWTLWITSTLLPAVAVGIAITRYRLYDIDRIVSNAVGYGAVSVVLLGVFWAVNLGLQTVLRPMTGGGPYVVAASTLLVAALFNPVRARVQRLVDRRFHRANYDAERLVSAFAGRLRDDLDLDHLAEDLRRTTAGAVEPTRTAIWFRAPAGDR